MGKSDTVIYIDFFWLNDVRGIVVDLKDYVADVHHWRCMCNVLGNVCVLVTILNEEEEIRYDAV